MIFGFLSVAQQNSRRGKVLQVRPMSVRVHLSEAFGVPHADTHEPETLPVYALRSDFPSEAASQTARESVSQPQLRPAAA